MTDSVLLVGVQVAKVARTIFCVLQQSTSTGITSLLVPSSKKLLFPLCSSDSSTSHWPQLDNPPPKRNRPEYRIKYITDHRGIA